MKILVIGLGSVGQRHLRLIIERFKTDSIYALRKTRRPLVVHDDLSTLKVDPIKFYGIQEVTNIKAAKALKPNVVFIATPTAFHLRAASEFLRDDVHLFIEKPLGADFKEAQKFYRRSLKTKSVIALGYQFQFHPLLRRLEAILEQKRLGRISSVLVEVGEYVPTQHDYEDYRKTYVAQKRLGGGVILTQSHEIDGILRLFGLPKKIHASSGHRSSLKMDVEDTADILCEYSDFSLLLHMDYLQKNKQRKFKVIGDKATAELDLIQNHLKIFYANGKVIEFVPKDFKRNLLFQKEHRDFFERIAKRRFHKEDVLRGLTGLAFCDAVKRASKTGPVIPKI